MLLFTNENHTSTLLSEIDALQHTSFTTICRYLLQKYKKFTKYYLIKEKIYNFRSKFVLRTIIMPPSMSLTR